jgi:hypothetical protein
LARFFSTSQTAEGSFSRFMTVNGYSSSLTVMGQPNQALLKSGLSEIHVLMERSSAGDHEALRALSVLQEHLVQQMELRFTTRELVAG